MNIHMCVGLCVCGYFETIMLLPLLNDNIYMFVCVCVCE